MKDAVGIACSILCICHCTLIPVLALGGGLGVMGAVFASEGVHQTLLAAAMAIAALTFPAGLRRHRRFLPLLLALAGLVLLVAALILGGAYETGVTVMGGTMIATAHFLNHAHSRHSAGDE